ncbi:hypothetical protein [Sulfobacillus harzensis]|uniref:DUF916 domain-containing protein n=1 Tax=Sulfobacillus harzensis TaxID=2729629 RepID=A0A7Y0L2H7_9FIRM|nr:hypothetical protein [Sulfobacillus harzensis]NMP21802.1 hypothetical protein [Sulfobacillus harzensis]
MQHMKPPFSALTAALVLAVVWAGGASVEAATHHSSITVVGHVLVTPEDWGRLAPGQPWKVTVRIINQSPRRLLLRRQILNASTATVVAPPHWLGIPRTITLPPHGAVSVPIQSSGGPAGQWAVNWTNALRSGLWDPDSPFNASAGVQFAVGPGYPWSSHPVFAGSLAVFNITNNPRYRPPRPAPQRACVSPSWVHARAPWLVWSPRAVVTASVTNLGHTPLSPTLAVRAGGSPQLVGIGSLGAGRTSATHRFRVKLPMIGLTRITVDAAGAAPVTRRVISLPGVWLLLMAMAGLSTTALRLIRRRKRRPKEEPVEDHQ